MTHRKAQTYQRPTMKPMIYLSGAPAKISALETNFGVMIQPAMGNVIALETMPWAADNGCFARAWNFKPDEWLAWLDSKSWARETCLFAVAPDVVGNAPATLKRSQPFFREIATRGFKVAYVLQDGQTVEAIPWDEIDCIFTGGSTEFKGSAVVWQALIEARKRGKWTHNGRVNTWSRLQASRVRRYDSVDGTCLAFGPDVNFAKLKRWLNACNTQAILDLMAEDEDIALFDIGLGAEIRAAYPIFERDS